MTLDQYLDFQLSKRYVAPTSKHQLSCQLNLFLSFLLSYPLSNLFLTLLLSQTSVLQEFCLKLSASVLKSHGIPCLHLHHLLLCCLLFTRSKGTTAPGTVMSPSSTPALLKESKMQSEKQTCQS